MHSSNKLSDIKFLISNSNLNFLYTNIFLEKNILLIIFLHFVINYFLIFFFLASGLGPESFTFDIGHEAEPRRDGDPTYHLRPEAVETWYFLQRITGKTMYKDWAWEFAEVWDFIWFCFGNLRRVQGLGVARYPVNTVCLLHTLLVLLP